MIELKDVSFTYESGETQNNLNHINLTIQDGETILLCGESGCGKTTVGRSLLRLYTPTGGEVFYNGEKVDGSTVRHMRKEMQMVFQDPYSSLNPRMTVEDIIGEPLDVHKLYTSRGERRDKIINLMELVGLNAEHATRYAHEFSGGQRQLLALAKLLLIGPELLLLDEPTKGLDLESRRTIARALRDHAKAGGTVIMATHDLDFVEQVADDVAMMFDGEIACMESPADFFADNVFYRA